MDITVSYIENEAQLKPVLDMCYRILGEHLRQVEQYTYAAWRKRLEGEDRRLLLYARQGEAAVSAVLARRESDESLVCGFVACREEYRGQGITKKLMLALEAEARAQGFRYITLGSEADGFYESCGYVPVNEMHGQTIYQKML